MTTILQSKKNLIEKNQDLKMFKILSAEQLPILQILQLIFIWGLNWLDMSKNLVS